MEKQAFTRRVLPALITGIGLTAVAQAQTQLYEFAGDAIYDRMGNSVASAGDVNGDGHPDVIAGATQDHIVFYALEGYARVYSGLDGSVLWTFTGDSIWDGFGFSVAGLGDLNNDGYDDVIVGAPNGGTPPGFPAGMARIYSGQNGSVLRTLNGDNSGDGFGYAVSPAGDVDGDGIEDVIIGAPFASIDTGTVVRTQAGYARVFSGASGAELFTVEGASNNERVGASVSELGNVNASDVVQVGNPPVPVADSFDDFIVGSFNSGVRVISGFDGAIIHHFTTPTTDGYGTTVCRMDDLNGDSVPEVVIGAPIGSLLNPNDGFVEVRSGRKNTGGLIHSIPGIGANAQFGYSLDQAGDWNGDGSPDLIIGSRPTNPTVEAEARIVSGASGLDLVILTGYDSGDYFGWAVAGLGDLNGDSKVEVGIGAPTQMPNGLASGAVRVISSPTNSCGSAQNYCVTSDNSVGTGALITSIGSTSVVDDSLSLICSGLPASQFGVFYYGNLQIAQPFGDGVRCVSGSGGQFKRLPVTSTGAGAVIYSMDFASETNPLVQITGGSTWNFQYWYRDPSGPGLSGFNLSNALSINFCP